MIVVDGKQLNLSVSPPPKNPTEEEEKRWNSLSDNERWVITEFQNIRKQKSVTLVDPRKMDLYRMATKPKTGFDVAATRINPNTGVRESWLYTDVQPKIKDNIRVYSKKHIQFFRRMEISTATNVDLAFMILNIVGSKKVGLIVENKELEAKKRIDAKRAEAKVENWIYDLCSENDIRRLSYRWGIHVEGKSLPELQVELFDLVKSKESGKDKKHGFQAFIDEMNSESDIIRVGSYFHEAVKSGDITFNKQNRTAVWKGTEETIGGVIPPERFKSDKEEYVIQWLAKNERERDLFFESLDPNKFDDVIQANSDYLMIKHRAKLMSWARTNLGIDIGMAGSVLDGQKQITEYIKTNKIELPAPEPAVTE